MAALGLASDPPLIDPAAYHCQQAAEKIFKELLIAAAVQEPRTHNLEILAGLVLPHFPGLADHIDWFIPVTEWAIATRYPDFGGGLSATTADVTDALERLNRLVQAARELAPSPPP